MRTKYPLYVTPVQANDEYSNEPGHCVLEVRPSVVLKLTWYLALTRSIQSLAKSCSEVRFLFPNIDWMAAIEEDDLDGQDDRRGSVAEGGFMDEDQLKLLFKACEDGLRGHEVQVYAEGYLRFLCYHKHSGVEFFSNEIDLRKLMRALRLEHVMVEIQHQVLLRKAKAAE